ncbi:FTR1 family iron permease [Peribacillus glennii]|uniref:FTR1 family iron permease n=1 Tax=Peribacillus glennii TaxID=2303991 RepID=A0A372L794_9BACI|nr:FTR1 family protein [Peribacillus glennii]RFU61053.1 FTR1 family iron permease [Peribacillus glennii]
MLAIKRNYFGVWMLALLLVFSFYFPHAQAAENHDELFVYIGDSLMKAKKGDLEAVSKNMQSFETEWNSVKESDSKQAAFVDERVKALKEALHDGKAEPKKVNALLSALSSSVVQYDQEQNPADKKKDKARVKALVPLLDEMEMTISDEEFSKAKSEYATLLNSWTGVEKIVREESVVSYGEIEKYMAFIRIGITQEPADKEKALTNLTNLKNSINDFLTGKVKKGEKSSYTLTDVTQLLTESADGIKDNDLNLAKSSLNKILNIWPMVEGDVQTRDSILYSDMETKIPAAISLLESKKTDTDKAGNIVKDLNRRLLPLTEKTSYSIWDAALILLREGLEALLIVATLLSFLKKVNHGDKQKWIWFGVGAGLLLSTILAVIINIVFSKITAASSREYIEGITGIAAVLMMITVGAWLHNKSAIGNWNQYINRQMGQAIAKGSLVSFAFISFLSIFREGAETIIFYAGMAPYMSMNQLLIGVAVAFVILVIVGYVIIKYSVKLPISLFFLIATLLIYALSFKILGISLHSLQVSQVIATHTIHSIPFIEWIGLYPTWETIVPQVVLLLIIIATTYWIKINNQSRIKGVPQ